ncbi:MAG: OmpA family protein [Brachymonas sp.]|nr:OmpA family protein [Brachymonas sp.]
MFSQDDDRDNRFALGLIFLLVGAVVASVIGFAAYKARAGASKKPAVPAVAALASAAPVAAAESSPAAADAASVKVENGVVKFYFASGKVELAQDGAKALADILAAAKTGKKVGISGYVDPSGDAAKNAELAKQRAFAVRDLLTSSGVPEGQIVLVRPNDIKAGATSAAEGRRVEVFMI